MKITGAPLQLSLLTLIYTIFIFMVGKERILCLLTML